MVHISSWGRFSFGVDFFIHFNLIVWSYFRGHRRNDLVLLDKLHKFEAFPVQFLIRHGGVVVLVEGETPSLLPLHLLAHGAEGCEGRAILLLRYGEGVYAAKFFEAPTLTAPLHTHKLGVVFFAEPLNQGLVIGVDAVVTDGLPFDGFLEAPLSPLSNLLIGLVDSYLLEEEDLVTLGDEEVFGATDTLLLGVFRRCLYLSLKLKVLASREGIQSQFLRSPPLSTRPV